MKYCIFCYIHKMHKYKLRKLENQKSIYKTKTWKKKQKTKISWPKFCSCLKNASRWENVFRSNQEQSISSQVYFVCYAHRINAYCWCFKTWFRRTNCWAIDVRHSNLCVWTVWIFHFWCKQWKWSCFVFVLSSSLSFLFVFVFFFGFWIASCIILQHFTNSDLYYSLRFSFSAFYGVYLIFICVFFFIHSLYMYDCVYNLWFASVFIIAFVCYALISGFLMLSLSHFFFSVLKTVQERVKSNRKRSNTTKKKHIERIAYNFCIEKLLHQSLSKK